MDTQPERPGDDRTQLIAVAADGRTASIEVGQQRLRVAPAGRAAGRAHRGAASTCWRGSCSGAASVAVFAGLLALAEGMLFANARIAMNDVYVTFFVVAALTLFVGLWLGRWQRAWQVVVGLIGVGLLLGLALASKWVAAYAIGGIALLILLRSALGRLIALAGMLGLTAVLGALGDPARGRASDPNRNWLFLLIMVGADARAGGRRWSAGRSASPRDELLLRGRRCPAVVGGAAGRGRVAGRRPAARRGPPGRRLACVVLGGLLLRSLGRSSCGILAASARAGIGPLAAAHAARPGRPVPAPPAGRLAAARAAWASPGCSRWAA